MFKKATLITAIATLASAGAASAAISIGAAAPTVDGLDISNADAGVNDGLDPIVIDGNTNKGVGQSFLTGGTAGFLNAVTMKTRSSATNDYSGVSGTQTFEVRIGKIIGDHTSLDIVSTQTITGNMNGLQNGDFITWTLNSSVALDANTLYGFVVNETAGNVGRIDLAKNTTYSDGRVLYQNYSDWNTTPVLGSLGNNSGRDANFHVDISSVPEPSSLALLGLGGLLIARRRRG